MFGGKSENVYGYRKWKAYEPKTRTTRWIQFGKYRKQFITWSRHKDYTPMKPVEYKSRKFRNELSRLGVNMSLDERYIFFKENDCVVDMKHSQVTSLRSNNKIASSRAISAMEKLIASLKSIIDTSFHNICEQNNPIPIASYCKTLHKIERVKKLKRIVTALEKKIIVYLNNLYSHDSCATQLELSSLKEDVDKLKTSVNSNLVSIDLQLLDKLDRSINFIIKNNDDHNWKKIGKSISDMIMLDIVTSFNKTADLQLKKWEKEISKIDPDVLKEHFEKLVNRLRALLKYGSYKKVSYVA